MNCRHSGGLAETHQCGPERREFDMAGVYVIPLQTASQNWKSTDTPPDFGGCTGSSEICPLQIVLRNPLYASNVKRANNRYSIYINGNREVPGE